MRTVVGLLIFALLASSGFAQDCPLDTVTMVSPRDGTTIFVDPTGTLEVVFEAEPDCVAETDSVEFLLAQPGSATFTSIGRDTTFPYRAAYTFLAMSFDAPWTVRAVAKPMDSASPSVSVDSALTFVAADGGADSTGNGLPDRPFVTLDGTTDLWRATGQFPDAAFSVLGAASTMYGYAAAQAPYPESTSIRLASPHNAGQTVTVKASQALLQTSERGVLIVAMAPDASSLMGVTQAARPDSAAPASALDPDGQYIFVSLLVSTDDGASFDVVSAARLVDHPIEISLSGLGLAGDEDYTLARYPVGVDVVDDAMRIASQRGGWSSITNQDIDFETGTLSGNLTTLGLFAPFREAEIGSGGLVEGSTTFWMVLSPILLALGILQTAEGGGPCFIATAAYGTPMAGDIETLRYVRDEALFSTAAGSFMVDTYYRLSPPIAQAVATSPVLAATVRVALLPVIWLLRLAMVLPPVLLAILLLAATSALAYRRGIARAVRKSRQSSSTSPTM